MYKRLIAYLIKNQDSLKREGRFAVLLCIWVGIFVAMNRGSWKEATELDQLDDFATENEAIASRFGNKFSFWESQSQRISNVSLQVSPAELKQQLSVWRNSLDGQQEWLATHVITQRKGFEPSVTGSVFSSRIVPLLKNEKDSPVPWQREIHSNAMQIIASLKPKQTNNLSFVRSLKNDANWIQFVFKSTAEKKDWQIWIVHTFSEQFIPTLLDKTKHIDAVLYNKASNQFLFSKAFADLKIDQGELKKFITSHAKSSGSKIHQFATHRKPSWVAWAHTPAHNSLFISVLTDKKIPTPLLPNSPTAFRDFFVALVWLINSYALLRWSYKKGFWRLRLKSPSVDVAEREKRSPPESDFTSAHLSGSAREREFCSHLLADFGLTGEVKLSGAGTARVDAIAAENYKGSWWTLKPIDKQRSFIAIGDTSGKGIAAGAASYTMKFILEKALSNAQKNHDNEELLKQLFNLCTLSAEGALLDSSHVAIFMAIISLDTKTMAFINAGYPAPMLIQNARKKVMLIADSDPLGLGTHTEPMPRWVNLTLGCKISICNVGVRNCDLPQLDESELIKITICPFGEALPHDQFIDEEGAA